MAIPPDLTSTGDMAVPPDQSMAEPATAQVVFADVVGTLWIKPPGFDGGVPFYAGSGPAPTPVHSAAALASFPSRAGAQHHSGTTLHDCNWNRYDLTNASLTDNPTPDENAGTVLIGTNDTMKATFHTATMRAMTAAGMPAAAAPDNKINCAWGGATRPYYGCVFSPSMVSTDSLAFPEWPGLGVMGFLPAGAEVPESLTANAQSTYKDNVPETSLKSSPDWLMPRVTKITSGATTITSPASGLAALEGVFNGANDITIDYDCNGACPMAAGGLTGLLIETHLLKKWDNDTSDPMQTRRARFGTMQCVDADFPLPADPANRKFVITKQMQMDILGSDSGQTVRVVLVRLKATQTFTGEHPIYLTAGRGSFAFIEQK